ncbi:gamma-glutamyl-gamma-aminobutyrate hydrolase family protein [Actinacidiphila sp. ITFR-21]|uniref:gamma-glutamyl-gamma-aminobutyrate hydrolase family protein n=1 Tax=Actinacidiphila sp. ITFR-21 TaxID=3075199 RepID=UPI00288941F2|nr:gamma-glutamyl-gamma-aminobutyrate hydrolase family protein [Streptomyces sp. ITFR-21]WNI16789.1 gamma-glutamyl-gamma-aminobutyrate hydrolase family protein [Streptomyces sp. ITFR-21]
MSTGSGAGIGSGDEAGSGTGAGARTDPGPRRDPGAPADPGARTPLVALACVTEDVGGVPHPAVRQVYVSALEDVAGCAVVLLPGPAAWLPSVLDRFDGLVLGGHESDVAPERYGDLAGLGLRAPERDELALSALPLAIAAGLPVLGICRGLQELNVAYGGTLRDIGALPLGAGHREDLTLGRDEQYLPRHDVAVAEGGLLRELTGQSALRVNSLHQQAIGRLAPGLRAEAVAPDGVIEAVSAPDAPAFALAVQWHPEWYAASDPLSKRLFTAFGAAAAERAGRRR